MVVVEWVICDGGVEWSAVVDGEIGAAVEVNRHPLLMVLEQLAVCTLDLLSRSLLYFITGQFPDVFLFAFLAAFPWIPSFFWCFSSCIRTIDYWRWGGS